MRQLIREDLAEIPPGPELARTLSEIELSRLSGYDCVEVLKARYRQVNHERARLMAAMVEVGLCDIGPDDELPRMAEPDEFSADEVRAALMLTRRAAETQFWLAHNLITRLPAVFAAMDAGILDEPRARVLSEWTAQLSDEQARMVCDRLLPRVGGLTTGQLVEQIKKLAIAIDPDWARRRYEEAVAQRKVVGYRNPDGSANLSGLNLPVDRVAAASGRIDALAKAAKRAGDARPIDHIRADLFLGMTDGSYAGMDDGSILDLLRTTRSDDSEGDNSQEGDEPQGGDSPGEGNGRAEDDRVATTAAAAPARGERAGAGMELRVLLSTLLGHDQHPGELSGWGPVHAELACALAIAMSRSQWRFAITDEHGQLSGCGITAARPTGWDPRRAGARQIVELQIPATELTRLAGEPTRSGAWAPVVADLARQYTSARPPEPTDPTRRFPGAVLRRYLQIRDRSCIMIGCRAPTRSADADHTKDHAHNGPTIGSNLGSPCRHDHRLKGEGGWRLDQPHSGEFRWTRVGI